MHVSVGFVFFACLLGISIQEQYDRPENFTAFVSEFNPWDDLDRNIFFYVSGIGESVLITRGDIIVFPEGTLTRSTSEAAILPDPKDRVIPYKSGAYDKKSPIYRISETAAHRKVYVVINLFEKVECTDKSNCPERGFFLYDTTVAFDRQGMVVARYRKYNVYSGNQVDKPDKAELSTFKTDFGVTFGTFTGFDILFKTPAVDLVQQKNVKHVVFPSSWPGEFPFLTGIQVQDGWSYAMNVSLLASGENDIENGKSGTGIYVARQRKISRLYEKSGSSLIHHKMATNTMRTDAEASGRVLRLLEDPSIPQSRGKDLDVKRGKFAQKICHDSFCCNFNIKYKKVLDSAKYKYRAVAFQGARKFGGNATHEVAYCAVVLCTDGNCARKPADGDYPLEFEDLRINAAFRKTNTLQFPSTLAWTYEPYDIQLLATLPYGAFNFERRDVAGKDVANVGMNLKLGVKGLVTFGIFGRNFE